MLGGCGRGRGQSCPSTDKASLGSGGGAWSVREEQARQWAAETLLALEALHQQGVLCRDLNPRNLLLDPAGRRPGLGGGEQADLPDSTGQVGAPKASRQRRSSPKSRGMAEVICLSPCLPQPFHQDSAGLQG